MPQWFFKLVCGLLPLGLTPALLWLIAEGYLNFGGGEKDILLLFPWLIWSVLYAVLFSILWVRKLALGQAIVVSIVGATGAMVCTLLILFVLSSTGWLGIS